MTAKARLQAIKRAREDPSDFLEFLEIPDDETGEPIVQGEIHRELQQFLTDHDLALVQFPREHGKTTQILVRCLWELGKNPNLRIVIYCHNNVIAARRVARLKRLMTGKVSARMRQVFPGLKLDIAWPDRHDEFSVVRDGEPTDPSACCFSITGSGTGARGDLIIGDDVVDEKNSGTPTERDKVFLRWTKDIMQLRPPNGRCWMPHTPWHEDDAHARLIKMAREPGSPWALLQKPINDALDPIWPEKWSREALRARLAEIGPRAFAYAFQLRVLSDLDQIFTRIGLMDADERA